MTKKFQLTSSLELFLNNKIYKWYKYAKEMTE